METYNTGHSLKHLMWNYTYTVNTIDPHYWGVKFGSGNVWYRQVPELIFTLIYVVKWHH